MAFSVAEESVEDIVERVEREIMGKEAAALVQPFGVNSAVSQAWSLVNLSLYAESPAQPEWSEGEEEVVSSC